MPRIIVGVDCSSHSRRALRWALSEAAALHAPLTVLSVRDDRAVTYLSPQQGKIELPVRGGIVLDGEGDL